MRLFGVSLGEGNRKVGEIMTFSLPSRITCPGASRWCLEHCYAWRYEQIRPACQRAYAANLALAQDTERFKRLMIGVLPRVMDSFRIHVSGDFFSPAYAEAWFEIIAAFPQTRFWAYTRSWIAPSLAVSLQRLRSLNNLQLFASVDAGMPLPPKGWRVAYVDKDARAKGLLCRAQNGDQATCGACGYCIQRRSGDVVFRAH